jgi:hypothetical protein
LVTDQRPRGLYLGKQCASEFVGPFVIKGTDQTIKLVVIGIVVCRHITPVATD